MTAEYVALPFDVNCIYPLSVCLKGTGVSVSEFVEWADRKGIPSRSYQADGSYVERTVGDDAFQALFDPVGVLNAVEQLKMERGARLEDVEIEE
ncbi:hypothetical protein [Bifidobacterium aesculapii]|uniref:hypothetical protein n=1 Tax=Bifidobacterium aesculapii TaxID=1329411 RepID=UPI00128F10AB|nr:hypothetical protein [Bifidobacterium aesculapii]